MMTVKRPKPVVLIILDGWGVAPASRGNAISLANTYVLDKLIVSFPAMTLQAASEAVGLPWGEMGGSEVGHINIGAGRIFYQDLPRITNSILDGSFFTNPVFLKAVDYVRSNETCLHLLGLVSPGGVHSSQKHLHSLLELAKKKRLKKVYVHAILDGRDTPYNSAADFMARLEDKMRILKTGKVASLSGRFYAMDRDNHWERTEKAYLAIAEGKTREVYSSSREAIESSYQKKIFDEEFIPSVIRKNEDPNLKIENKDAVIFFNFRPDRARQLTKAFVLPGFEKFERPRYLQDIFFITMTEYEEDLPVEIAFPPEHIKNPLAKIISEAGLRQLHIAETEKYAHITYFLNGGREEPFEAEEHILIPSPRIASYDKYPKMSAKEVTKRLLKEISLGRFDFIAVNFANVDMVAHTGDLEATIKAVEVIDECLGRITQKVLAIGGVVIITSDHGNAEELIKLQTGDIDKEHSTSPVPFILVGKDYEGKTLGLPESVGGDLSLLTPRGMLSDVTPTILKIMGLKKPKEMTGTSLI